MIYAVFTTLAKDDVRYIGNNYLIYQGK